MADSAPSSEGLTPTPRSRSGKELRLELKRTRGQISCAECRRYVSHKSHKRFSGTTEKLIFAYVKPETQMRQKR